MNTLHIKDKRLNWEPTKHLEYEKVLSLLDLYQSIRIYYKKQRTNNSNAYKKFPYSCSYIIYTIKISLRLHKHCVQFELSIHININLERYTIFYLNYPNSIVSYFKSLLTCSFN